MAGNRATHYEALGVRKDAGQADIERAYRKVRSQMDHETAAPDPRRKAMVDNAYEALSDPQRRADYDAALAAPMRRERSRGVAWALGGAIVLAAAAAGVYLLRPEPPPPPGTRSPEEVAGAASYAMGRVEVVDLSGKSAPVGLAFAVDQNVMVTSCAGISPTSQITIKMPPRVVPARVAQVDEKLGVCKLAAEGVGSRPLTITGAAPKPGDKVYAVKMNAVGESSLVEAVVKRSAVEGGVRIYETSVPVLEDRRGGPVLDTAGRVIGVALLPEAGKGRVVALSPEWILPPRVEAPPPTAAPPAEPATPSASQRRDPDEAVDAAVNKAMGLPDKR